MYASIRKYRSPLSTGGIADRMGPAFVAAMRDLPGFRACYLVEGVGVLTTVGLFDDREAALGSLDRFAAWVTANLPDLYPSQPPEAAAAKVLAACTG